MPSKTMVFTSSVFSSTDSSTTSGFDTLDEGWIWSTSLRDQHSLAGLPGGMMITGQLAFDSDFVDFGGQFMTPSGVQLPRVDDSWNVFWNGWQYLRTEGPASGPINTTDGRADLQGVGLFARAGVADRDTNPVEWTVSGGFAGRGVVPGRDDDTFGIGYAYSSIQDGPFVTGLLIEEASRRVEAYYTFSISPAVEVTFDAQWVDSLLATEDPAVVLGVRLPIRF